MKSRLNLTVIVGLGKDRCGTRPYFFSLENFLSIQPHDAETFDLAAQLRAGRGMKFIDALHYATAIRSGCKFFITYNGGIQSSDALEVVVVKNLAE